MKFFSPQWLLFAATIFISSAHGIKGDTKVIPSASISASVDAYFTSTYFGLDGPKLSAINESSFDWWYFDTVSTDLKSSLVIVFYTASAMSFPFLPPSTEVLTIGIYAGFPNGTVSSTYLNAQEAVITTTGQGSSGVFAGTGSFWQGAIDNSWYNIKIVSPNTGTYGNIKLISKAPAHYPCGPVEAGQNMMVGPNIGWSNAVPDSTSNVDFTIGGSKFAFAGLGYHDKNWSNQPFFQNVGSWYWGHGRVGEYSLVWFDFLSANGTNSVSAYVSKAGKVVASSCTIGSITVRPSGANSTYPPKLATGNPGGFSIIVRDGGCEMDFAVTTDNVILSAPGNLYTRWTGVLSAKVGGTFLRGGQALFEQFKLSA